MADFTALIQHTELRINDLHSAVHETFKHRDESAGKREAWKRACAALHTFDPPIAPYMAACQKDGIENHADLRAFAIAYVAVDPMFFRSGYDMEKLLPKIKRLTLNTDEKAAISATLVTRIKTGGRREFRALCRLIPAIQTADLTRDIQSLATANTPSVRARAKIAAEYLPL